MRYLLLVLILSGCGSVRHLSDAKEMWILEYHTVGSVEMANNAIYHCVSTVQTEQPKCYKAKILNDYKSE